MQQQKSLTCTCIGNLFNPHQTLFLTRKKLADETVTPTSRRNQSNDIKIESTGKPKKKSLKKRPLSNSSVETPVHNLLLDENQVDSELKISFEHEKHRNHEDFSFSKGGENSTTSARLPHHYPATTRYSDLAGKHNSYNTFLQRNYQPQQTPSFTAPINIPHQQPMTPRQFNYFSPKTVDPNQRDQLNRRNHNAFEHKNAAFNPHNTAHKHETRDDDHHIQKTHFSSTSLHQEDYSLISAENLLIEEFDHFFKNKGQPHNYKNLQSEIKPYIKTREAMKPKPADMPLFIGRFAESDNEQYSESAPSEVIGKGFQSHFNDFWDNDSSCHVKETLASRSTNTKISFLGRGNEQEDSTKATFGNITTFKSYQNL